LAGLSSPAAYFGKENMSKQKVKLKSRELIAGKLREVGDTVELYPWEAEHLKYEDRAEDVKAKGGKKKKDSDSE
jgi:hypothetical protein